MVGARPAGKDSPVIYTVFCADGRPGPWGWDYPEDSRGSEHSPALTPSRAHLHAS